jgi:Tfp pilus assembly protein PilX
MARAEEGEMRRLTTSQEGVALPVATAMLLVISLFVIAFFSVTLQLNDTSVEDRSTKRALAAAEAGLQTALYRMNEFPGTAQPTQCFTTGYTPIVGGECPPAPEVEMGNGASFWYYVTPQASGSCVGTTVGAQERCITAVGEAGNDVQRRVQVLANVLTGAVSYKSIGLMSKTLMYAGNSSEITSEIGSNGIIHFGNSAKTFTSSSAGIEGDVTYGPVGSYEESGSSQEIAGDLSQTSTPFEFEEKDFEAAELAALNKGSWTKPGYNQGTKVWTISEGSTQSLTAGIYLFCRIHLRSSSKLNFATNGPTEIYIDSPSRSGSPCPANTGPTYPMGTFWAENSNRINEGRREDLVEIFMYGTPNDGTRSAPSWCSPSGDPPNTGKCKSDFLLNNSSWFEGMVNAPNSTVEINNSGDMFEGAIAANKIRFNNSVEFKLTAAVKDSAETEASGLSRGNWVECRPQPTNPSDPESGC